MGYNVVSWHQLEVNTHRCSLLSWTVTKRITPAQSQHRHVCLETYLQIHPCDQDKPSMPRFIQPMCSMWYDRSLHSATEVDQRKNDFQPKLKFLLSVDLCTKLRHHY